MAHITGLSPIIVYIVIVDLFCDHTYCFIAVRADEITEAPMNVATKVHQSISLHCAGNGILQWDEFITSSKNAQPITYGKTVLNKFKENYSLNTDSGKFELVIKSPVLSDGGKYRCKAVTDAINQYGEAEVIVFGKTYFHIFRPPSHPLNLYEVIVPFSDSKETIDWFIYFVCLP